MSISIYEILMITAFVIGYVFITIEHITHINKASIALLMAITCWALQFANQINDHDTNLSSLGEHMANISQVVFFLLGALTIVEVISLHRGFQLLSKYIRLTSKRKLLWLAGFITFFLSSVLDNLTTTIIMVTLLIKLLEESEDRLLIGGAVVIAANAGGAWTPIGDVTTTMLWIGGQLSTLEVIHTLFLPSLACMIGAFSCLTLMLKGQFITTGQSRVAEPMEPNGVIIFWLGIGCLVFVPFFKLLTGLPPFMGMIFGLALLWLVTDLLHRHHPERQHLRVPAAIKTVDVSSVLFFLGILLSVDALHAAGLLDELATQMNNAISHSSVIAMTIGLASAVVDNVPLVAAVMGMYDLGQYPVDSEFWNLVAYCAGTGGSILVIGSAAGVALMGLERVNFSWYFKKIGLCAFVGYFIGIGVFYLI